MGYTYILLMNDWRYYTWSTTNLGNRIKKHNNWWVRSTKPYRPLTLLGYKKFSNYSEARQLEIKIKRCKSKEYIETLLNKWNS